MTPLDIAKFWMKVAEDKSTKMLRTSKQWLGHCWIWRGFLRKGYGIFSFHQQPYRAHRIAFFLHNGYITDKLFICHKCDNPQCVNPLHLFEGTSNENTQDMIRKGRLNRSRGENKGISYRKETGKWRARYMHNYKNVLIGEFDSRDEALKALNAARSNLV